MKRSNLVSEETILKAINGDVEAFTEIYKVYYKKVFFIGVQYFKNEDKAKDIVQDVFIKVYKQISKLQTPKAFSSWLYVITYRECHDQYKRKSRVIPLGEDEQIEDFADVHEVDVVNQVENERVKEVIMVSLDTMNTQLRAVGVMRFFGELKTQEIADILDLPKSTVSSQLHKIRKKLEIDLKKQGFTPTSSYSVLIFSPTFLYEAYEKLSDKYSVSEATVMDTLQKIITGSTIIKVGGVITLPKILASGLISLIALGIFVTSNQDATTTVPNPIIDIDRLPVSTEVEEELAKIESIIYNQNWTKERIHVDVKTSNLNYDALLFNDSKSSYIIENGTCHIKLIKDDQVIDEREIVISNIDIESPYGVSERNGNDFTIHIYDMVSGVDPSSIVLLRNGVSSNDYGYDTMNNTLTITTQKAYSDIIFISDYAGNVFEIQFK